MGEIVDLIGWMLWGLATIPILAGLALLGLVVWWWRRRG